MYARAKQSFRTPSQQRGIAVITVMLILALMATLAAFMVEDNHIAIKRTANAVQSEQGFQAALTGEQWALAILREDLKKDQGVDKDQGLPVNDHLKEDWVSVTAPPISIPDAEIEIQIIDESAKFNLNNLYVASKEDRKEVEVDEYGQFRLSNHQLWLFAFQGLLQNLGLDDQLRFSLEEWLDPDTDQQRISEMAAEDYEYQLEDPPYRAANRLLEDLSELRLIKGFDDEVIEKLRPYVTVLPSYGARMNANTCDPLLFQSLFRATGQEPAFIKESEAEEYVKMRGDNGIVDFTKEDNLDPSKTLALDPKGLFDEKSRYFRIISRTKMGRMSYGVESLVRRSTGKSSGAQAGGVPTVEIQVLQRRRTLG